MSVSYHCTATHHTQNLNFIKLCRKISRNIIELLVPRLQNNRKDKELIFVLKGIERQGKEEPGGRKEERRAQVGQQMDQPRNQPLSLTMRSPRGLSEVE